jgi:hypothetical protein
MPASPSDHIGYLCACNGIREEVADNRDGGHSRPRGPSTLQGTEDKSCDSECAKPQTVLATITSVQSNATMGFRPKRSDTGPYTSSATPRLSS